MDNKESVERLVQETLDSVSGIKSVQAPPFFKDKVLIRMAQEHPEKKEGVPYFLGLVPSFQFAVLIALILVNVVALYSITRDDSYGDKVETFAEIYGFSETDTDSYFYQN